MSPTLSRLAAAVTCAAGLAVAAVPAGASTTSPIPNYPNPQFDPAPDFPVVRAADGTIVPIPNYPNPQFDPQS